MHYSALLHVFDPNSQLSHVVGDLFLTDETCLGQLLDALEPAIAFGLLLLHICVEFLSLAVLHEQVDILVILEEVMQLHDVRALQLPVHLNLLSNASCQILSPKVLLIDDFESVCIL